MVKNFTQAEKYLNSHVRQGSRQIFQGAKGLKKMRYFLALLGSPQNKLKVIHIAGTAGKGSTCYFISSLLSAHGFKVGLHLSPHLTDVRERFQINNKIISKKEFVLRLIEVIPYVEKIENSSFGDLSYFEVLVGLAFYIFNQKKVDYAVIETGLGGWYDATNVVDRPDKTAVLTKIGFDHMEILGQTLKDIAIQKAMIIQKNNFTISTRQKKVAEKVIKQIAKNHNSKLILAGEFLPFFVNLIGDYQKENASLALKTVQEVSQRDGFEVNEKIVKKVFAKAKFIGRFDIKRLNRKTIILDGAHNEPKMEAFASALKKKYPNNKFHFLLAFKKDKDYGKMLKFITPLASKITITSFFSDNQDLIHLSEKPEEIRKKLNGLGFKNHKVIADPKQALESVLKNSNHKIVITGSLYLLGEIYKILRK